MRGATISLISAIATIGITACAQSGEATTEPPARATIEATAAIGPAVGENIPEEFAARDSRGRPVGFADIAGARGAVLVFHRSADWCPACQDQLAAFAEIEDRLGEAGFRIAAVSIDGPEALRDFAARSGIGYALLSDEGGTLIRRFGFADPVFSETSFAAGAARPAAIVVDADGRVRASIVAGDYRRTIAATEVLAAVERLGA